MSIPSDLKSPNRSQDSRKFEDIFISEQGNQAAKLTPLILSLLPKEDIYSALQAINKPLASREIVNNALSSQMEERTEVTWNELVRYKEFRGEDFSSDKVIKLDLSDLDRITDEEVLDILARFPQIQTLDLANCIAITNRLVEALPEKCPRLRTLNLSFCTKQRGSQKSLTKQ